MGFFAEAFFLRFLLRRTRGALRGRRRVAQRDTYLFDVELDYGALLPAREVKVRGFKTPVAMTRFPLARDAAAFSAAPLLRLARRYRVSSSTQAPRAWSNTLGVDAIVNWGLPCRRQ